MLKQLFKTGCRRLSLWQPCYSYSKVKDGLLLIFQQSYRELRPRAPIPDISIEFFSFANINNTIRLREGKLLVRLSDLLEGAPAAVVRALAHILLAKIYRKPIARLHATRYRRYVASRDIMTQAHLLRQMRGRKHIASPRGRCYDLEKIFDELNTRFFSGFLARPQLSWSQNHARNSLGHYDPAHNAIVVSRVLDDPQVPQYALEYVLYHEMLHLRHPVELRGSRRSVHSAQFQAEEKLFPHLDEARQFLRRL